MSTWHENENNQKKIKHCRRKTQNMQSTYVFTGNLTASQKSIIFTTAIICSWLHRKIAQNVQFENFT